MQSAERHYLGLPMTYWYLWVGTLINRMGSFVFTFLAVYLTDKRGFSIETVGYIISLYGLGSLVAGPLGGVLTDRVGRRPTLILGLFSGAASMLLLSTARQAWSIAAAAFIVGVTCDMGRPAAQAAVTDLVPSQDRTRAFGFLYWAMNLGFAGSSILAGLLAKVDFFLLFLGDALTLSCFGVIVWLRVKETRPARSPADRVAPPIDLMTPYRDTSFALFVGIQFLVAWLFWQSGNTLPLDMQTHQIDMARYGQLLAINGVLIVLLQPLSVRYVGRFPRGKVLALGALLIGLGFGLPAFGHSQVLYAGSIVVWTLGEIIMSPVTPTVVSDLAPTHLRGSYQGGFQLCWGAAALLGPSVGGLLLNRAGARPLWLLCGGLGILAALLHLLVAPARRRRLSQLDDAVTTLRREDGQVPLDLVGPLH